MLNLGRLDHALIDMGIPSGERREAMRFAAGFDRVQQKEARRFSDWMAEGHILSPGWGQARAALFILFRRAGYDLEGSTAAANASMDVDNSTVEYGDSRVFSDEITPPFVAKIDLSVTQKDNVLYLTFCSPTSGTATVNIAMKTADGERRLRTITRLIGNDTTIVLEEIMPAGEAAEAVTVSVSSGKIDSAIGVKNLTESGDVRSAG